MVDLFFLFCFVCLLYYMLCPYIKFKMLSYRGWGESQWWWWQQWLGWRWAQFEPGAQSTTKSINGWWQPTRQYCPQTQRYNAPLVLSWPLTTSVGQLLTVCMTGRQNAWGFLCHIFCTYFSVEDINPNLCWSSHAVFTISLRAFSTSRCLLVNGQQLWRLSPLVRHTQCWWEGRLCVCQLLWRPS